MSTVLVINIRFVARTSYEFSQALFEQHQM